MINLLPVQLKDERRFGRLNQLIVKQLVGIVFISILSTAVMLSGLQLTKADLEFLDESIAIKTAAYTEVQSFEEQANELRSKVNNIKKLFDGEVRFSKLLVDIASAIPVGAQLTDLSLTGSSTEPLQITADANSQDLAGVLRKNLVDSGIFEAADIVNVTLVSGDEETEDRYSVAISASLAGSAEIIKKEAAAAAAAVEAAAAAAAEQAETTQE